MRWVCQLLLLLLVFLQENQNGTTSHNYEDFFQIQKQYCLFKSGETPIREDEIFPLWDYLFAWVSQCNWKLVLFMGFGGILLEIILLEIFTSCMTRPGFQPQGSSGQLTAFHWEDEEVPKTSPRKDSGSKTQKRSRSRRHFGTIPENDDELCYTEYSYQDITPAFPGRGESGGRSSITPASSGRGECIDRSNIIPVSPRRRESVDRGNVFPASPGRRECVDRSHIIPVSLGRRGSAERANFIPVSPVRKWSLVTANITTIPLARRDSTGSDHGCQFRYPFPSGAPRASLFHSELREHPPCQRHLVQRECEIIPFSPRKSMSILKTPNPNKHRIVRFSSTCPYNCVRKRVPASENLEGTYFLCPPPLLCFPNNQVRVLGENDKCQILSKVPVLWKRRCIFQPLKNDLPCEMPLSGAADSTDSKTEETPLIAGNSSGEKKEKPSDSKTEERLSVAEKSSGEGKQPKALAWKDQEAPQRSSQNKNQPPPSGDKQKNNILEAAKRKPILKSTSPKMTKWKVKDDTLGKSTDNSTLSGKEYLGKVVISQGNWEITTEAETPLRKDLSPAPQGQTVLSTDEVREVQVSTLVKEKNLKVTCSLKMHERKTEAVHLKTTRFPKTYNPQNPTPESQNELSMRTEGKALETRQGLKPETVDQSQQKVHSFQEHPVPEEEGSSRDHTSAKCRNQNFRSKEEMQPSELNLQHKHPTSPSSSPTTGLKPLQEVASEVPTFSRGTDPRAAEGANTKASQTEAVSVPKIVRARSESHHDEKQMPRRSGLWTQAPCSSRTHRPLPLDFRERHEKKKADEGLRSTVSSVFPDDKTKKGLERHPRKMTAPGKQGIVKQVGETQSTFPSPSSESGPAPGKETVILKKLDITHHCTTQKQSVAIKMHLLLNPNSSVTHAETREIPQTCALSKLSPEELNKLTMSLGVRTLEMKMKIPEAVRESFTAAHGCGQKEIQSSEIQLKSQVSKSRDRSWPSMEEEEMEEKDLHPEDLDIKHKCLLESPVENLLPQLTQGLEMNTTQETRDDRKDETLVSPPDTREGLEQHIYEIPPSFQTLIKPLIPPDFQSEFHLMSMESLRPEQPETSSTMSAEALPPHDVISNMTDSPPLPEESPPLLKKKENNKKVHFQMSEVEERDSNPKDKTIPHPRERERENTQKSVPLQKSPLPSEEVSEKFETPVKTSGVECECYELQRYESFPVYADLHKCPCETDLRIHYGFQRCRTTERRSPPERAGTTPNPDSVPRNPGRRHNRGRERHSLRAVAPFNKPHQTRKMKCPIHKSQSHHRASGLSVGSSDVPTGPHSVFSPKTERGASQPPLPESTDRPLDEKKRQFHSPPGNQEEKNPPAQLLGKSNKYLDFICNYEEVAEMQRRWKKKEVNAKPDPPEVSRSSKSESKAVAPREGDDFISRFALRKPFFYICSPAGSPGVRHKTIRWNIPHSILSQSGFRTPLIASFSDSWNTWRCPRKLMKSLSASFSSDSSCHQ